MADVFISYAREDREEASALAKALEAEGYSVWWDRQVLGGDNFDVVIERELDAAGAVVVMWSKSSVGSTWVRAEAATAVDRGVLIPALIENIKLPLQFRHKQTVDLTSWGGDPKAAEFLPIRRALAARLGESTSPTPPRPPKPPVEGKSLDGRTLLIILLAALSSALAVALVMHFTSGKEKDSASESASTLSTSSPPSLHEQEQTPATPTSQDTPAQPLPTPQEREPEKSPTPAPVLQEPREEPTLAKPEPATRPARSRLCEKYGNYTAESWRRSFLHETEHKTWHVFVASLEPDKSEAEAESRAQEFRRQNPKHDFQVMPTASPQGTNWRYAVVMAEGLTSAEIAREIARYADRCGIAPGAYAYQQAAVQGSD